MNQQSSLVCAYTYVYISITLLISNATRREGWAFPVHITAATSRPLESCRRSFRLFYVTAIAVLDIGSCRAIPIMLKGSKTKPTETIPLGS